jgi:hypothetical protein
MLRLLLALIFCAFYFIGKVLSAYNDSFIAPIRADCQDFWSGTAPFCNPGSCPPGYHVAGSSNSGNGAPCWTGTKILCQCNDANNPPCTPSELNTDCLGVALICDNGCSTWWCGLCVGFWWDEDSENVRGIFFQHNEL